MISGVLNKESELKLTNFYDFLLKVNYTNGLIVLPLDVGKFEPYRYRIKKGNNSVVLKNAFKQRLWWVHAEK